MEPAAKTNGTGLQLEVKEMCKLTLEKVEVEFIFGKKQDIDDEEEEDGEGEGGGETLETTLDNEEMFWDGDEELE
ncbi:hypothetical protein Tco_0529430 [Tanacetum coccineum]